MRHYKKVEGLQAQNRLKTISLNYCRLNCVIVFLNTTLFLSKKTDFNPHANVSYIS